MSVEELAAELLAVADAAERRTWLAAHRPSITLALMEALKAEAERYKLRDPRRAGEMAEVALEAASFSSDPLATAVALWTQGNISLYTGDFEASVETYQTAEVAYAAQGDGLSVARLQSNRVFALTNLGRHRQALALAETARQELVALDHSDSVYMATLDMNVGVACRQAGHYDRALAAYEQGRIVFERLGHTAQAARMEVNRSKVLEKLDRFREAASLLTKARQTLLAHDIALDVARADLNLAHLAFRRGRYRQALEGYARAREGFVALDNDMEVASVDFYRSRLYLSLNLFSEAHELASHARRAFLERGMARYAIQATAWQAAAARGLGDVAAAVALFEQARAALEERGETLEVAFLDLQRAALLRQTGQLEAALETAGAAAHTLERYGLAVRLAQARLTMADCLLDEGRADEAACLYTAALEAAEEEALATLAYRARYGLGQVAQASGDDDTASRNYETAAAHLEAIHRDLQVDEFQASFVDDKLKVYEAAVRLALQRGDVEAAFDYVERAKAGALLDLLARGLELTGQEDDELLERLQALREAWHWHASQLEDFADDKDDDDKSLRSGEPNVWATIRDIERQLSETWRQLRLQKHRYAILGGGRRLSLADVQARLPDDTLLMQYYATQGNLLAFLVTGRDAEIVELGVTTEKVEDLIATWRFDLDSLRLMLPDLSPDETLALEADSRIHLRRLYQTLVAPSSNRLAPYRHLIVVPHRALHYLPFSALHDGQGYLVDRFHISYLPGASLLTETSEVGLHHPLILAYSDGGRLPHALDEARQIAALFDGAQVFLEDEATEARLREHAPACGLLHLATHGAFRADNPLFSWLRLADARLTVRDVYGLHLPSASLVTLSACETGLGGLQGGDVLGLSRGFLAAGARLLLLSLWPVDDVSTAHLMTVFYGQLAAGQKTSAALRAAQQTLRQQHPHPFYWAGFVLVGRYAERT